MPLSDLVRRPSEWALLVEHLLENLSSTMGVSLQMTDFSPISEDSFHAQARSDSLLDTPSLMIRAILGMQPVEGSEHFVSAYAFLCLDDGRYVGPSRSSEDPEVMPIAFYRFDFKTDSWVFEGWEQDEFDEFWTFEWEPGTE